MESLDEVFFAVKDYCSERLVDATYRLFIHELKPVKFEDGRITILVRSDFLRQIILERYDNVVLEAFRVVLGFEVKTEYILPEAKTEIENFYKNVPAGGYAFTFENFIVGSTNKFAHAAAHSVATNPSGAYNPLFIYGQSGLGKTHLLSAMKLELTKNFPDFNIVYVDGENFTNEIIAAIRDNSTEIFREKYREADVLLVDDIQFMGGKEGTQEEFFHTFNALYNTGKQIVLASDRPPKEIKSLEDRLRTRFEWGLTADIQPPDFETRVAIIHRKANLLGLEIPGETAEYISNNLKNNIRQLEGTVKKLNAMYTLEGIMPVLSAAQTAIKDILSENEPLPVTLEKILSEVARTFGITPVEIRSKSRNGNISNARKTSMYIVHEVTGMTMQEIGKEFGGRDHSTVVYSLNGVKEKISTDRHFKEVVEDIIKNVKP